MANPGDEWAAGEVPEQPMSAPGVDAKILLEEMPEKRGPNQLWEARFDPATTTVRAFCKVCDAPYPAGHTPGCALAASQARAEALERAAAEELCECGSFDYPAIDEHDADCPYRKWLTALAAAGEVKHD